MIISFRHRGLRILFEQGNRRGVPAAQADKIELILARLHAATGPASMRVPGYRLYRLKGDRADEWSIRVSANWRIVFRFDGENVRDVDLTDYH